MSSSDRERRLLDRAQRREDIAAGVIQPTRRHRQHRPQTLVIEENNTSVGRSVLDPILATDSTSMDSPLLSLVESPLSSVPPSPSPEAHDTAASVVDVGTVTPEINEGLVELLQTIMAHLDSSSSTEEAPPLAMPTSPQPLMDEHAGEGQSIIPIPTQPFANITVYWTVMLPPNRLDIFYCPNLMTSVADTISLDLVLQAMCHEQPGIFQELQDNIPNINLHLATSQVPIPPVGDDASRLQQGVQPLGRLSEAFSSTYPLRFATMDAPETLTLYTTNSTVMNPESKLVVLHIYFRAVYMPLFPNLLQQNVQSASSIITPATEHLEDASHGIVDRLNSLYPSERASFLRLNTKVFGTAYTKIRTVRIVDTIMDQLGMSLSSRHEGHLADGTTVSEESVYEWAGLQAGTHQNSRTFAKKTYCLWKTLEARVASTSLTAEQQNQLAVLKRLFATEEISATWKQESGLDNVTKQTAGLRKSTVEKMIDAWTRTEALDEYGTISWE
ncbi:hypothetical protein PC9H_011675 [Pleurotus ostreatus]|uniref:Uncharacterized protein n=1 Tax=Pleurotus ostreatus TaxID=5322 RepID=A0A8H6ZLY1_PLEOS|nr:uncharacterized protein PC9H_011675 [Pleurotus ostreatus]KAF7421155.1 hypothetical protein PC9H_011675 [Pleurotus ostreatus]